MQAADDAVHDKLQNTPFPSRLGQDLGQSLGIGFAAGIEDSAARAGAAASAVAASAILSLGGGPYSPSVSVPVSSEVASHANAQRSGRSGGSGNLATGPLIGSLTIHAPSSDPQAIAQAVTKPIRQIETTAGPI